MQTVFALLVALLLAFPAAPMGVSPAPDVAAPAGATFDEIAVDLIGRWEGKRNAAYQDIVGVWTICYGHTRTAEPGQVKTDAECEALLLYEIKDYQSRLYPAFTPETIANRLPATRAAAYVSLAYNVGVHGASRSTAVRRLNRGDVVGGCSALTWWNRAGKRVVRGLVNRRAEEYKLCMVGAVS